MPAIVPSAIETPVATGIGPDPVPSREQLGLPAGQSASTLASRAARPLLIAPAQGLALALALALVLVLAPMTIPELKAQPSGGDYVMRKQVIGAGEASSAGPYVLTGTVAEVGAAVSSSPRFRLTGGFHGAPGADLDSIFCDGFESAACPD